MDILANELMFITSHKVRKPIATCLGLIDLVKKIKDLRPSELEMILDHLKSNMLELDEETKRLTLLLYHQDQKSRLFRKGRSPKEYFLVPPADSSLAYVS